METENTPTAERSDPSPTMVTVSPREALAETVVGVDDPATVSAAAQASGSAAVTGAPAFARATNAPPTKSLLRRAFDAIPWLPLLSVVLPTGVSVAYYGVLASDIFISESHFVVRSAQRQAPTGLASLIPSGSFARSQDDAHTVHDFMRSRDAMKRIDDESPLRETFGSKRYDALARFNGFNLDGSNEALFKHYQKAVSVDVDTSTGISTLRVNAFTADDAARINERLLQMGETLVNDLNERGRKDLIRFAQTEVAEAEEKSRAAALALSAYRNEHAVFDPERQGALQLQGVSKLQDELISTTVQITQLRTLTPDNPQLPALERRLGSLQNAMQGELSKVAGGTGSLSKKAADFERLSMDRVFAEKQLATALSALEQARSEAQRKQLYLERIAQPSRPDIGLEPRRGRSIFTTFLVGFLLWGIMSMLVAGVREHRD